MKMFKEFKKTLKIVKKIKEIKKYFETTHLTNDVKNDISIIREALNRLGNRIAAVKDLIELIF